MEVYLDNSATTKCYECVRDLVGKIMCDDYGNPSSMHKKGVDAEKYVRESKEALAKLLKVQEKELARLPESYKDLENGHMGTHKFLIDDFCKAVYHDEMPVLNAWFAARVNVPGLVAIESSNQGGIPLDVPDFGDAPMK